MTPEELDAMAAEFAEQAAAAREALAAADKAVTNVHDARVYLDGFGSGFKAGVEASGGPIAQATADALMADLAKKGMLRTPPTNVVETVERDRKGRITSITRTPT